MKRSYVSSAINFFFKKNEKKGKRNCNEIFFFVFFFKKKDIFIDLIQVDIVIEFSWLFSLIKELIRLLYHTC